jgi:hypothetical protein
MRALTIWIIGLTVEDVVRRNVDELRLTFFANTRQFTGRFAVYLECHLLVGLTPIDISEGSTVHHNVRFVLVHELPKPFGISNIMLRERNVKLRCLPVKRTIHRRVSLLNFGNDSTPE